MKGFTWVAVDRSALSDADVLRIGETFAPDIDQLHDMLGLGIFTAFLLSALDGDVEEGTVGHVNARSFAKVMGCSRAVADRVVEDLRAAFVDDDSIRNWDVHQDPMIGKANKRRRDRVTKRDERRKRRDREELDKSHMSDSEGTTPPLCPTDIPDMSHDKSQLSRPTIPTTPTIPTKPTTPTTGGEKISDEEYYARCCRAVNNGMAGNKNGCAPPYKVLRAEDQQRRVTWATDMLPIDWVESWLLQESLAFVPKQGSRGIGHLTYFDGRIRKAYAAAKDDEFVRGFA